MGEYLQISPSLPDGRCFLYSAVNACSTQLSSNLNTLRPRQMGRHFADGTFKRIFLKENVRISIKISLKFVPKCPINNITALFQIMAWRRPGDKPISEPMMVSLPTHICVTRPQWVNVTVGHIHGKNEFRTDHLSNLLYHPYRMQRYNRIDDCISWLCFP